MATLIEAIGSIGQECAALPHLADLRSSLANRPLEPAMRELLDFLQEHPNIMIKEDYARLRMGLTETVNQVIDAMLDRATNALGEAGFVWARPSRTEAGVPKKDPVDSPF